MAVFFLWVLDRQALRVLSRPRLPPRRSAETLLHEAAATAPASPGELVSDAGPGMGGTTETQLVSWAGQFAGEKDPKKVQNHPTFQALLRSVTAFRLGLG